MTKVICRTPTWDAQVLQPGCEVTVAHAADPVVDGSRGIRLGGHRPLDEVLDQPFDLVYLPGGMAHQETWDPKPFAPSEYRGPYKPIDTNVDGLQFSENFKHPVVSMHTNTTIF